MTSAPAVVPRPHPLVVESDLDGSKVLFHLGDRRLHFLNGTAAAIWDELRHATTLRELTSALSRTFAAEPSEIRSDVERTVGQFRADGLAVDGDRAAFGHPSAESPGETVARVDLPASGAYAALDARVGVRSDDAEVLAVLGRILDPLALEDDPTVVLAVAQQSERVWTVTLGDGAPFSVGSRLAAVLRALGEVNNAAVASAPRDLVLHAGAVGDASGVVLLPAGSNHGKSTLTTALVRAGFGYLTDEAAAVADGLVVRPFPKAIALDPGSFPLFPDLAPPEEPDGLERALACREWHVAPDAVGATAPTGPARVVVCPHWRPGSTTRLHRSDPTEALHLLIGEAFDFRRGGQVVFERLVGLVARIPVYRLGYSDLREAVAVVEQLLRDPERPPVGG